MTGEDKNGGIRDLFTRPGVRAAASLAGVNPARAT
jgi:hypothetical protein